MSPAARATDPWTSKDAAMRAAVAPLQDRLIYLFENSFPMTDDELIAEYARAATRFHWKPASPSGIRSRRSELVDMGYLIDTGRTALTPSGRHTIIWGLKWLLN